ncbi:MAG: plastocyanin/azurin family copper-binding protein [Sphingobacteriaceae bacterium]
MKKQFLTLIAAAAILASCGGNQEQTETTTATEVEATQPEAETTEAANSNAIEITANDQMKFSETEIKVKAGEEVTITLKNVGTVAKEAMGHNFVVLQSGTDVDKFGLAAVDSKSTDYIPESFKSAIVAHTKLLGPNESDTITFTLEKGTYEFICSFPGHYSVMRGKIIAE